MGITHVHSAWATSGKAGEAQTLGLLQSQGCLCSPGNFTHMHKETWKRRLLPAPWRTIEYREPLYVYERQNRHTGKETSRGNRKEYYTTVKMNINTGNAEWKTKLQKDLYCLVPSAQRPEQHSCVRFCQCPHWDVSS